MKFLEHACSGFGTLCSKAWRYKIDATMKSGDQNGSRKNQSRNTIHNDFIYSQRGKLGTCECTAVFAA